VWQPTKRDVTLAHDGDWHTDGPQLPIEFARRTNDGWISLVIVPGAEHLSSTLWTMSALSDLDEAHDNLRRREGTSTPRIHGVHRGGGPIGEPVTEIADAVAGWIPDGVDYALWTGLPPEPTWLHEGRVVPEAVLSHAHGLDGETRRVAREYVANAPDQTATPLRPRLLAALGGMTAG
jgi:hypothetical protein